MKVSFLLEKELTIELQKIRRELYFLHAAALSLADKAFLNRDSPGTGKSTTVWALLYHDAITCAMSSLRFMCILCGSNRITCALFKKRPPLPYLLPGLTLRVINSARAGSATAGFRCFTTDAAERDVLS